MTTSIPLSSPGNKVLEMLTWNNPVSSAKTGKPSKLKSKVYTGENLSGQEISPAYFEENHCCGSKPESKTLLSKNNRAEFVKIFSKLYAGVYEIK